MSGASPQPPRRVPASAISARALRAGRLRVPTPASIPPRPPCWRRVLLRVGSWAGWGKGAKAVAITASLGTAAAAVAAVYITNQTLDATRQQNAVTEQGQYTDRYGRAVEQLGSEKADIRLGGIYALERLAHDSPRDAGTITNILGGFVRNNARCTAPPPATPPLLPADLGAALTVLTRRPASDPPSHDPSVVQADLKGSCLAHLDFRLYDLANVDLSEANLSDTNLYGVYMAGVSLTGTNLAGARLTNSVWLGTNITSGNLSDANLTGAVLNNTIFAGTNLRGAVFDQTHKDETTPRPTSASSYIDLNQAIKTYAVAPDFYTADLTAASFRHANLPLTTFTATTLDRVDFTGAQLPDATFTAAKSLTGTTFNHAHLTGASFHGLDLRYASFVGADLTNCDLSEADLRGVDLSQSNLTGANLTDIQR
jgi:uncharacterized protein YjbI with pentapeptide repeats